MSPDGVVIVGGGLAGQRCAETLRRRGHDGRIRMVCAEPTPPYDRPPLSKGLLAGEVDGVDVTFRPPAWYADNGIDLLLGAAATGLRPAERIVELGDDGRLRYEKLLVATGSRARRLPALDGFRNVHVLRTLADAVRLREALAPGTRLVVVGAGFIGQEVAATARGRGIDVTLVEALGLPLAGVFDQAVGRWVVQLHRRHGVKVLLSARVTGVVGSESVDALLMADGSRVECDAVLVGVGVVPAAEWLEGSGLEADGVVADADGRTSADHVFAAGDVACTFDARFGAHVRTEHWDAAARQGAGAALAMLGLEPGRRTLPSFWSDQYGVRIQYVGHAQRADGSTFRGDVERGELLVVYTRGSRPVAALAAGCPREFLSLRREIELSGTDQPTETKEAA